MPCQRPLHVLIQRGKAPGQQVLLGAEMVVKGPGGDSRPLADIPHGHFIKAVFPGQNHGGLQNGLLCLFGLQLAPLMVVHTRPPLTFPVCCRYNNNITLLCDHNAIIE